MAVHAEHLGLLQRVEQVRVRAEEIRTTVSRQIGAAVRLVSAAQRLWQHDLLIAALVVRGHAINLHGGDRPHLVIDGVHATFEEAMAFHRDVVTLADIEQLGALSGRGPDSEFP